MKTLIRVAVAGLVLVIAGVWVVAQVDLTTFQAGEAILAEEVNSNFEALRTAVEGAITSLNGKSGDVTIAAGSGISIDDSDPNTITIHAAAAAFSGAVFPMVGNGVGGSDCASQELEILIFDDRGQPTDYRFTFLTPGTNGGYGQIRTDGSIRSASANVSGVTKAGTGSFCVAFTAAPGGDELESTIVGLATN